MRIGVDTGGTFTDFVVVDGGLIRVHKCPSSPDAPERAILEALATLGVAGSGAPVVHGSTVATNAVLEGQGARTALVTSHGFGDMLTIGRQARRALYDLQPSPVPPPVSNDLCFETGGRVTPDGEVLEPLDEMEAGRIGVRVAASGVDAVAICLLFSFVDDRFERMLAAAMPAGVFISRSSAVLPEYREYERGIATWLNARVGPLMAGYLERLAHGLDGAPLSVLQSSGGTVAAAQAAERSVHLLLSGPAGGVAGAAFVGRKAGLERLMTMDMGGTSTDVSLVDGEPRLTTEGRVAQYPVAVPMVDIHTIGAGGGSVAWIDAGGILQVGPRSAGAVPGPACYGQGGIEATVTDANLVLGRLPAKARLGGSMALDLEASRRAVGRIAGSLGMSVEDAATGIVRITDEHMAQALRVISIEQGEDPREFTLMPFGGAAGLHACSLAQTLGMRRIIVPVNAGVLSALGMLVSPAAREKSRTLILGMESLVETELEQAFSLLTRDSMVELVAECADPGQCTERRRLDLRYTGQSHTLEVEWSGDVRAATEAFHAAHARRYGHRLDMPVEMVNLRVRVEAGPVEITLPCRKWGVEVNPVDHSAVHGLDGEVGVYRWASLPAGQLLAGPAIVLAEDSTLWIAPAWTGAIDGYGNATLTVTRS